MYIDSYIGLIQYGIDHKLDLYWINRYIKFIIACSKRYKEHQKGISYDKHHVLPRSWNGQYKGNIISIPVKAHIIAHHILARSKDVSMIRAFQLICSRVELHQFKYGISIRLITESTQLNRESNSVPIVNLTTGEVFASKKQAAEAYNVSDIEGYRLGMKVAGCYWQTKDQVDKNGIEYELKRIQDHKIKLKSKKPDRVRKSQYKDRKIICIDDQTEYDDYIDLASKKNIKDLYRIITNINKLRRTSGLMYQFKDAIDQLGIDYWKQQYQIKDQKAKTNRSIRNKKVINLTNNIIYDNIKVAAESLNVRPDQIKNAIFAKCRFGQCYWSYYYDSDNIQSLKDQINDFVKNNKQQSKKSKLRPVYNLNTREYYPSATDASKSLGLKDNSEISGAISKAVKIKGCYWQYVNIVDQIGFEQALKDQINNHKLNRRRHLIK